MPADVSYLYSVSPPFHSAFASDFYAVNKRATEYNCGANHNSFGRFPTSYSTTLETIAPPKVQNLYPSHTDRKLVSQLKLKSIISQKKVATNSNNDCLKRKDKKVTFADTQGQSLTLIKYLTESTNEPPKSMTSGDLIRDLVKNLSLSCSHSEPNSKEKKFTFKFSQPVANYVQFKRRIELHNVSLENIMIQSNSTLCGTVKVKNLSFNKTVNVRVTFNNWESYLDHPSQYVRNAYENGALDTFHFNVAIPQGQSTDIQLCIQYVCDSGDFWDNNWGENYVIAVTVPAGADKTKPHVHNQIPTGTATDYVPSTYTELPGAQYNSWLEWEGNGPFY